jgi:hypothetical protein
MQSFWKSPLVKSYKQYFFSLFFTQGKAEDNSSPALSRVRSSYYGFTLDALDLHHPRLLQR